MPRKLVRALGSGIAAMVGVLALVLGAGPAAAVDKDLGWVRLEPASGTTDIAVLALTESACPSGRAATVRLSGPGVPASAGNLVGVTEYSAFEPTLSGQLWIPLSFTFRDWFNINGVKLKTGSRYSITVVCRDLLRSSVTFGSFAGQVVFDSRGGYEALGAAAKPFDTQLKPEDPLAVPTAAPSSSTGAASSSTPAASPSAAAPGPASPRSTVPAPAASRSAAGGAAAPAIPSPGATATDPAVAQPAPSAATSSDSTARNVLLGLAALLIAGLGAVAFVRRPGAPDEETPAREHVDAQ